MTHWFGGFGPVMAMGMGLFWVLVVGGVVWLVVALAGPARRAGEPPRYAPPAPWPPQPPAGGPESPFDVLDRRLAAGEIDLATYRETRAALLEGRRGQP